MVKSCLIIHWRKLQSLAVEHYALKEILIFTVRVDSGQASEYGIRYHGLPEGEDASFFLCKELVPGYLDGITGEYATPEGYLVDEQEAEEFDKQFLNKEKKKLPGQLF